MDLGTRVFIAGLLTIGLLALMLFMGMSHMFGGGWNGESFGYVGFAIGFIAIIFFVIFAGKK